MKRFAILCCMVLLASCASRKTSLIKEPGIGQLKQIGYFQVAHNKAFQGTTIGGLSGIDYDAKNDLYYLISDDRSAINSARFYTAKLLLGKMALIVLTGFRYIHYYSLREKYILAQKKTKPNRPTQKASD
jgi:hypothetical protein